MDGKHSTGRTRHPRDTAGALVPFAVTVDVVLMTILRSELRVFLIQHGTRPHPGEWALPGGLVMESEPLDGAALRMVDRRPGSDPTRATWSSWVPMATPRGIPEPVW